MIERRLEVLPADILVVNVDAVGGQALQRIARLLLFVVEAGVEAELPGDEVELLVGADGPNDGQALLLGDLADQLADGAGGRRDEDGLAPLGLSNLVQARPGREAGHAQGAGEDGQVQVVGVVDLEDALALDVCDGGVLGQRGVGFDDVARLEVGAVALDHLAHRVVDNGVVERKGRRVRLDAGVAHLGAQVGVERGVEHLDDEAALGGTLEVDFARLHDEVLAGDGQALGDLLVDESLVGDHLDAGCGGCKSG